MSYLGKFRKEDIVKLMGELDLAIPDNPTIAKMRNIIVSHAKYDEEFTRSVISNIVTEREREEKNAREKLESERLEREFQLEQLKAQNYSTGTRTNSVVVQNKTDLTKIIKCFDSKDPKADISTYLALFERQATRLEIKRDDFVMHLLGLLPLDIAQIITREPDNVANDYDHIKGVLLKRFKLTGEQFRQKLFSHKKENCSSWREFAFELNHYFEEWLNAVDVKDFTGLSELIVSDQLKRRVPHEVKEHFLDVWHKWNTREEIVEKLEEYEAARVHLPPHFRQPKTEQNTSIREPVRNEKNQSFMRSHSQFKENDVYSKIRCNRCLMYGHEQKRCVNDIVCLTCKRKGHKSFQCPQMSNSKVYQNDKKVLLSNSTSPKKIMKEIKILNHPVLSIWDSGSELTLCNFDVYKKLNSPALEQCDISLTGINKNQKCIPEGFFKAEIIVDGFRLSAEIFVVKNLCTDFIIGFDVLSKLNVNVCGSEIFVLGLRNQFSVGIISVNYPASYPDENGIETLSKKNENFARYTRVFRTPRNAEQEIKNKHLTDCRRLAEPDALATEKSEHFTIKKKDRFVISDQESLNNETSSGLMSNCFLINLANAVVDECEYDLSHISQSGIRNEVESLIENYKPAKTKNTDLKMHIVLSDEIPVCQKPRRMAFAEQKIVEQQISEWLEEGIIKHSSSNYSAPVVLCKKKDGSHRLCVDYRKLNKKTIKDHFPLPLIEDVLDHLSGAKVFTTLDLKSGFFHVDIDEKSTKYTSFVTHNGQFEFCKVAFGLTNSPSVFQRYIYRVFRELLNDNTLVIYMDDIVIPSSDEREGLEKLQKVFKVASEYGLKFNFKKCQFLKKKIEFLGYTIENGTICPSKEKIKAVQNFPEPKNVKKIQSFLGLTGYFRKFIPHYSKIAKPLSDLLRNGIEFQFGPKQRDAFNHLKELLATSPVLHIFQQGLPLEVHTDASMHGFGAMLLQKDEDKNDTYKKKIRGGYSGKPKVKQEPKEERKKKSSKDKKTRLVSDYPSSPKYSGSKSSISYSEGHSKRHRYKHYFRSPSPVDKNVKIKEGVDGTDFIHGYYNCEVCHITLNSITAYQTHINGTRHQKNLKVKNMVVAVPVALLPYPDMEMSKYPKVPPGVIRTKVKEKAIIQDLVERQIRGCPGLQNVTEIQGIKVIQYYCGICDSVCSDSSIIPHLRGFKHKLNSLQYFKPEVYERYKDLHKHVIDKDIPDILRNIQRKEGLGRIVVEKEIMSADNSSLRCNYAVSSRDPSNSSQGSERMSFQEYYSQTCQLDTSKSDFYCEICESHMKPWTA